MPMSNLMVPLFPDVPIAPGVPPVLRQVDAIEASVVIMTADTASLLSFFTGPQWGLFDQNGNTVLGEDSVISLDYREESRVADYPVEQGAFASYSKVLVPYDVRIGLVKGGAEDDRAQFLQAAEAAARSLNLYTVVAPDYSATNVNIVHWDFTRTSRNGANLLLVTFWLREIRNSATQQFSQTKSNTNTTIPATGENARMPSGADPVNQGVVQPQTMTPAQLKAIPLASNQADT